MKRGVSAMVSLVLLVIFVISLATVIMMWSSGLVKKSIKRSETRIGSDLECMDVNIVVEPYNGNLLIKNNNKKDKELEGYIVKVHSADRGVVDRSKENNKVGAYGAIVYDYNSFASGEGISDIRKIEIIPRIKVGDSVVDCTLKMISYDLNS